MVTIKKQHYRRARSIFLLKAYGDRALPDSQAKPGTPPMLHRGQTVLTSKIALSLRPLVVRHLPILITYLP